MDVNKFSFSALIWLFPLALALHEAEEWYIIGWYERNFVDLPPKTDASTRTFLVFMSLLGFVWTGLALLFPDPRAGAFLLSLLAMVVLLNALQHLYWLWAFRAYAPGVITSLLFLIPLMVHFGRVALEQALLPMWYVLVLLGLVLLGLVQTVRAGNRMTASFRAMSRFGRYLAGVLGLEK